LENNRNEYTILLNLSVGELKMTMSIKLFQVKQIAALAFTSAIFLLMAPQAYGENSKPFPLPKEDIRRFLDVFDVIDSDYVTEPNKTKIFNACLAGMLHSLDAKSAFLDEDTFNDLRNGKPGSGVGLQLSYRAGLPTVVSSIDGSPAQRAGIRSKDYILTIDGESMEEVTLEDAVKKLRGNAGSSVNLTIRRLGETSERSFTLVREVISSPRIRANLTKPGIGYMRIPALQSSTGEEIQTAYSDLERQNLGPLKGLILDIRDNPGGTLPGAIEAAAMFLPKDALILSLNGRLPDSNQKFYANQQYFSSRRQALQYVMNPQLQIIPLILLVNEGTAAGAEIIAGAFQDYRRAILVGSKTFGLGSIQTIRQLDQNTAVKLTTAYWKTPSGHMIQNNGIIPDHLIKSDITDTKQNPVFSKALELIERTAKAQ
jgi:carboxyl-terminal processing protease